MASRRTEHRCPEESNEAQMALFQRCLDATAFETLVGRLMRPAVSAASQLLPDQALAEDAVQEAFLRVVRSRDSYRPGKSFSSWFYAILRNVCSDMRRRNARQARLIAEAADAKTTAGHEPGDDLDVTELLARLPDADRIVLTLRVLDGLAFGDIAVVLGISTEAAKKRAQRALRRLREDRRVLRWLRDGPIPEGLSKDAVPDLVYST